MYHRNSSWTEGQVRAVVDVCDVPSCQDAIFYLRRRSNNRMGNAAGLLALNRYGCTHILRSIDNEANSLIFDIRAIAHSVLFCLRNTTWFSETRSYPTRDVTNANLYYIVGDLIPSSSNAGRNGNGCILSQGRF